MVLNTENTNYIVVFINICTHNCTNIIETLLRMSGNYRNVNREGKFFVDIRGCRVVLYPSAVERGLVGRDRESGASGS